MRRRVVFICSHKGGVGKTTFARGLLDVYRSAGLQVAAYDCDGAVGQLLQYYGLRQDGAGGRVLREEQDALAGVDYFDVRDERERDGLLNAIERPAEVILFDLPGDTFADIANVVGDPGALFSAYVSAGYEPVVVVVMSHLKASSRAVLEAIECFGDAVRYVAVKALVWGESEDFVIFDGAPGRPDFGRGAKALREAGGEIVLMPKLHPRTYALLDHDDLRFSDAARAQAFPLADRLRVARWLASFRAALAGTVLDIS
jgi:hypothetical protein